MFIIKQLNSQELSLHTRSLIKKYTNRQCTLYIFGIVRLCIAAQKKLRENAKKEEATLRNIVIIDDHPLMATATKELLERSLDVSVIALTRNAQEGLETVSRMLPDLVLLDYRLPDMSGSDVAEQLNRMYPDIHVVIFSGIDVTAMVPRLIELQVSGIISKESPQDAIVKAVACVLDGFVVFPQSGVHQLFVLPTPLLLEADLTEDEIALMTLIVKGHTLEQVADAIHMSKRSVDNYQRRVYDKLGVKGRAQAIEAFIRTKHYLAGE